MINFAVFRERGCKWWPCLKEFMPHENGATEWFCCPECAKRHEEMIQRKCQKETAEKRKYKKGPKERDGLRGEKACKSRKEYTRKWRRKQREKIK